MFEVKLLGGASIEGPAAPLSGPAVQRHRLALLALLAAAHPGGSSRDKLGALLWPERGGEDARKLLNQAVHKLRKALGAETILSAGDELRLGADRLPVDLIAFREAMDGSRFQRAVDLYGGLFLDGFHLPDAVDFERWAESEGERLRQDHLRALERLAEEAATRGERRAAAGWWRRAVEEAPYSGRITVRLMEALEAAGERAEAIRQAEEHGRRLEAELGAEPSPAVLALAERMRSVPRWVRVSHETESGESDEELDDAAGDGSEGAVAPDASPGRPRSLRWAAVVAVVGLFLLGALAVASSILSDGAPSAAAEASAGHKWIAVLPFEDLTGTRDALAFTEAIHGDLIVALSGVASLRVISRGSTLPYRDRSKPLSLVAEELGVDVLVEGGVQRLGERVRVNVQLTEPHSGELMWAESFTRSLSMENLFEIRSRMVEGIAASVEAALTAEERQRVASPPTQNLTAYQYLHQVRLIHGATLEANREAVRLLRLAVELDPGIAEAWESLASRYSWRAPYLGVSTAVWDTAMLFAERALEADPEYGPAYSSLASIYGHQGFLAQQAQLAERALALSPSDGFAARKLGLTYRGRGEFLEALRWHQESVRLSPFAPGNRTWVGRTHADLGQLEQAASWYRGVLAMSPDDAYPLPALAALHLRAGRPDSAAFYAEKLEAGYPDEPLWLTAAAMVHHYLRDFEAVGRTAGRAVEIAGKHPAREADGLLASTLLGFAESRAGDREGSEALFEQSLAFLESMVAAGTDTPRWPYEIGLINAARGDLDQALDWLETAYDLGFRWGWMLDLEPMLDPLREWPRFQSVRARVEAEVDAMRNRLSRTEG